MSSAAASKAWTYTRRGPIAEVLSLTSAAPPSPASTDVVVKVSKAPIHRWDAAVINGTALGHIRRGSKATTPPFIGGVEGVGTLESGTAKGGMKAGDTVWIAPPLSPAAAGQGTWSPRVAVDAERVHKIDPKYADLAVYASSLLTAQQLLASSHLFHPSDVVLQSGGSSVTSLAVSALAQDAKVPVLTTAVPKTDRFAAAVTRHKQYGSTVFEYNAAGKRAIAKELESSKKSLRLFLSGVGGRPFNEFCKLLSDNATVINYGAQSGFGLLLAPSNFIYKGATLSSYYLPTALLQLGYDKRQGALTEVLSKLSSKNFTYPTKPVASLEELPQTWDDLYVQGGGTKGVITLSK